MKSTHRLLLGACLLMPVGTMFSERPAPAADHAPAVAERVLKESPQVIRRYGSSEFRWAAGQLAFSLDGRWLAAGNARSVVLFDAKTGEARLNCKGGYGNVSGFAFSPDGKSLALADPRGLSIWDIQKGAVAQRMEGKDKTRLTHGQFCAASPDRQWRVNHTSQELALARWDQLEPVKKIPFRDYSPSVAIGNEGKWIAAAGRQGNAAPAVHIWKAPEFDSAVEWKHRTVIRCLAASPDGELLYAGVGDQTVRIWNIKENRETSQFEIDSRSWPVSMAVSPDGKLVAVASTRSVTTYEADTGRLIHKVEWVDQVGGAGLAFAPDGRTLAISPGNRSVELWDVKTGQPIHQPGPSIENVFATEDSRQFGSYSEGSVCLWNSKTGDLEESFPLYPWPKEEIAPPGQALFDGVEQLIIKQPGGEVFYRDLASSKTFGRLGQLSTDAVLSGYSRQAVKVSYLGPGAFGLRAYSSGIPGDPPLNSFALLDVSSSQCLHMVLSEATPVLAAAFADGSVFIWHLTAGKERYRLKLEETPRRLFLNATGEWLAISHEDSISVWDLKTGKQVQLFETTATKSHTIAFGSKLDLLAAAVPGKPIRLWNLKSGKETITLPAPDFPAESMAFSPDDKRLAVGYQDKTIGVFDLSTREESQVLEGHTESVTHLAFDPDGSRLASASQAPEVFVWDTATGKQLSSKSPVQNGIRQLSWVLDGKEVLVVDEDHHFLRYPAEKDQLLSSGSYSSQAMRPTCFAYYRETGFLAVGYDKGVRILDQTTGRELPFLQLKMGAHHMEWSSDGGVLMIASDELFGWDVDRQKEAYRVPPPLSKYESRVTSMERSPDGRFVATGHSGRLVCVWDPQTGKRIRKIENQNLWSLRNLRFSPDGRLLFGLSPLWYHIIEVESGLTWIQKPNEDPKDTSFAPLDRWTLLAGEAAGSARLWTWAPTDDDKQRRTPEQLWEAMFTSDGSTVCQSMFDLADQGDQTVEFLAERLPLDPVPDERMISLIKDLEDDSPAVRRKASEDLLKLGSPTRPHLESALEDESTSPRVRIRIRQLLSALDSAVSRELLAARAVQLLEWIDTPKARALLQEWANTPTGRLGSEAQATLRRLSPSEH